MATRKKMMAQIELTTERAADLLCGALEGGSNYWYLIDRMVEPKVIEPSLADFKSSLHIAYPLSVGGALIILDTEANDGKQYRLNLAAIARGWKVMAEKYPRHFMAVVTSNDDAETADVFLQCCLFGEALYG